MRCIKIYFLVLAGIILTLPTFSQKGINHFLYPSDSLNKPRLKTLIGTSTALIAGSFVLLNDAWYKDYPRSRFHFFNDNAEWLQMDKVGHVYSAYNEGLAMMHALEWAGVSQRKAAWGGFLTGTSFQLTIEILDGFSSEWGFSPGDFTANEIGAGMLIAQEYAWREQRIHLKFSSHRVNYPPDPLIQARIADLYGNSLPQRTLKDYNGQTYWLSINLAAFLGKNTAVPKWLNLALGYGAEGMYGAVNNTWTDKKTNTPVDLSKDPRHRQFYLSFDADLSKINTKSAFLKTVFHLVNTIKLPFPALEYNGLGKFELHPFYF